MGLDRNGPLPSATGQSAPWGAALLYAASRVSRRREESLRSRRQVELRGLNLAGSTPAPWSLWMAVHP
jgi:hypothetical protein